MSDRWQIGVNVPWNAGWTGEDSYEIRNCRWASGRPAVWSPHKPGEGRPIFAKPHMVRQRRSIAEMRCTVCGEKTAAHDRWWFALGQPIEGWALATTEAPVHRNCADRALAMCPHLNRLGHGPLRFPPPHAVVAAIVGGPRTERDFGLTMENQKVVGHLKFVWRHTPLNLEVTP